ncbi:DsbA family protein [Amycolatopsis sp. NPDC059090]|uniref:DsbA family oxidoreductase n=1 Tax=unclassified Amycolatopsis TaxID=2618356 RepID=UPI00366E7236
MTEPVRNPSPRVVTVWSDLGCPWASLALTTLHAAADQARLPIAVDHRSFPLELFNRRATPKAILDAEIVAIAGVCADLRWQQWAAPESSYPVTTVPAMAAVQAAKDERIGGLTGSDELDALLRHAFYAESRCISVESEILDLAADCPSVDEEALAHALGEGAGIRAVHEQWRTACRAEIVGSPHLFVGGSGSVLHNPGVDYHWTARPDDGGFPRLVAYDPGWADALIAELTTAGTA